MCRSGIMLRVCFVISALITATAWLPRPLNAAPADGRRSVISEHGATGDGKTLNTKAIQSVIEDCARSGGGTVVVPKGVFITGAIFLKAGVNLCVEKDGVLKGSENTNDYP